MKFIGALIWATGDPDKKRSLNVLHPLALSSELSGRKADSSYLFTCYLAPVLLAALALVVVNQSTTPNLLVAWYPIILLVISSVLGLSGFSKICVSRVIVSNEHKRLVFYHGIFCLAASALTILNLYFL